MALLPTAAIRKSGPTTIALIAMLWGTTGVFARWSGTQPLTILHYQAIVTLVALSIIYSVKGAFPVLPLKSVPRVLLSAVLKFSASFLYFTAIQLTTLCYSLFAYYTGPVLIVFFASVLLHERLELRALASLCIAVLGVAAMTLSFSSHVTFAVGAGGVASAFGGAVCFALMIMTVKSLGHIRGPDLLFYQMLLALPLLVLLHGLPEPLSIEGLASVFILGLAHKCLAYSLYYQALPGVKAQYVGVLHYLDPVVASTLGYLVFREAFGAAGVVGGVLVILAGVIVIRAP